MHNSARNRACANREYASKPRSPAFRHEVKIPAIVEGGWIDLELCAEFLEEFDGIISVHADIL